MTVISEIWENREAIVSFGLLRFYMRFSQNPLSFVWLFLEAISMLLIFTFVFTQLFRVSLEGGVIFFLSGLLMHRYVFRTLDESSRILVDSRHFFENTMIASIVPPFGVLFETTIIYLLESILLFVLIIYLGIFPHVYALPFLIFIGGIGGLGLGLFASAIYVKNRSIGSLIRIFGDLNLFFTPIFYRVDMLPMIIQPVYLVNPLSRLILLVQQTFTSDLPLSYFSLPFIPNLLLLSGLSVFFFIAGWNRYLVVLKEMKA